MMLPSNFPGGPVVKTLPSSAGGVGLILVGELEAKNPKHNTEATL